MSKTTKHLPHAVKRLVGVADGARNVLQLPRLPVPDVEQTLHRYVETTKALKKPGSVERHEQVVQRFLASGQAAEMQAKLVEEDYAAATTGKYPHSYIERLWDDMYLGYRGASAVNLNPAFLFTDSSTKARAELFTERRRYGDDVDLQAFQAAQYVSGMVRFAEKLRSAQLDVAAPCTAEAAQAPGAVEVSPKRVQCVSQFGVQFGFARIPKPGRDVLAQGTLDEAMQTVAVLYRGHVFIVDLQHSDGTYYSREALAKAFRQIVLTTSASNPLPVCTLTGAPRDDWTNARAALLRLDPLNYERLRSITRALCMVCLDEASWDTAKASGMAQLLGLDGSSISGEREQSLGDLGNRWYDKHQIIVEGGEGGRVAGNFEHSFSDGRTWARWASEVHAEVSGTASGFDPLPTVPLSAEPIAMVHKVDLNCTGAPGSEAAKEDAPVVRAAVRAAKLALTHAAEGLCLDSAVLPVGSNDLKALRCSPDAFCQAAYHLAFFRLHGRVAPTYESCSTAGFYHGRTETIRTASPAMYAFVSSSCWNTRLDSAELRGQLRQQFDEVQKAHRRLAADATRGHGVDRHLTALKAVVLRERSTEGLAFFNEHFFEYSGTWRMSTSNVSEPFIDTFNFGPVCSDGYGIGYTVKGDEVRLGLSSFTAGLKEKDASMLGRHIVEASDDLLRVLRTE